MKRKLFQNKLIVMKSPTHGYGVFAGKTFRKGEKIEECYAIISRRGGDKALEDYYFDASGRYAVLTGFGSIYNHSDDPSVRYTVNRTKKIATLTANRTIRKGEEIFVDYGEKWFSSRGMASKENQPKKVKSKKRKKSKK